VAEKPVNGVANGQLEDFDDARAPTTKAPQPDDQPKDLVCLTKADKQAYEEALKRTQGYTSASGKKVELVPVWTLEDSDGKAKAVGESPETQGRFRKYAEQGICFK
jgi:hypothetical protein